MNYLKYFDLLGVSQFEIGFLPLRERAYPRAENGCENYGAVWLLHVVKRTYPALSYLRWSGAKNFR